MSPTEIPRRLNAANLAVSTTAITKRFGKTVALAGLELTVPENSFYLLVGSNGAGKSTTMRILLDLVRADAGTATVFGVDTRNGATARAQIGWVPDRHDAQYSWMTAAQLIDFHSHYYTTWDAAYAKRIATAFAVDPNRKMSRLSKGEIRRVQLLLALAHRPRLLLLDEPTDGLDPAAREMVLGILAEHMSDSETTVLVATHLVYELDRLADHIGVLRGGSLIAQMSRDEMDQRMHTYSLQVPAEWNAADGVERGVTLLRKNERQRELEWTVWGDESDVTEQLIASGATVRDVSNVTLEEGAIALMQSEGSN